MSFSKLISIIYQMLALSVPDTSIGASPNSSFDLIYSSVGYLIWSGIILAFCFFIYIIRKIIRHTSHGNDL